MCVVVSAKKDDVGGQNLGGVRGTPTNTTKQEFGSRPGHKNEMGNVVIDQMPTMTTSRSQNDPHEGHKDRMQETDQEVVSSVGFSTNDVESERGKRVTTVCESDPHGMAVGMNSDNTEQYEG